MESVEEKGWDDFNDDISDYNRVSDEGPPAGVIFDIAPPAPQRPENPRSTVYAAALSHSGALRRVSLDPELAARSMPTAWVEDDDPADLSHVKVCSNSLLIPVPFDDHCVLTAFERDLDRVESKFRAGRKDKSIGGELGSIVIKRKVVKGRKTGPRAPLADGATNGSLKRPASGGLSVEKSAKKAKEVEKPKPKPIDYTLPYRTAIKSSEIAKSVKARANFVGTQMRMAKGIAAACARESRKSAFPGVRIIDDAHRRARRILRDVLAYWKKEDKERQEERKKLMARAEEHRKLEADERETQRQKNKLKFLLGQSEAFSTFLKKKTKATDEAGNADKKTATKGDEKKPSADINDIKGTEDDDELRRISEARAAELVRAHQARIKRFDTETMKKKSVSDEASAKAAANRAAAREALDGMNGVTEEERDAIKVDDDNKDHGAKQQIMADDTRLAGSEKPEVAAVRQPSILNCKMKDYQLRGLAWLVSLYDQGINGILADEMGLGKTLQTISFLAYLCEKEDNWGPFLVVSPKATLHNWQQEVTKFCPSLKVLPYWGNKNDRNELRKYWSQKRMYRRDSEFQVCITSYETLTVDEKYFSRVKWQYLVLDEAQAIKNSNSSRWRALLDFPCRNRLLLTGTPLQNKLSELWSLLHFIMPQIFDSHAEFTDWFAKDIEGHAQNNNLLDATTLARLRTLLDPFMLRRVKRDVESEMPPKTEVQLSCFLSARQRQLYAGIKANISPEELTRVLVGTGPGGQTYDSSDRNSKLMNLVMQLRKVCNHPETFERRVPQSPVQIQLEPPPSHVAPPPSILQAGNEATAPVDVTLVSRAAVIFQAPRQIRDLWDTFQERKGITFSKYGLWTRERLRSELFCRNEEGLSIVRLSGGISVAEANECMALDAAPLSSRHFGANVDDQLLKIEDVYSTSQPRRFGDNVSDDSRFRPHRLLLQPRAMALRRRQTRIILRDHISPAEMIEKSTRLLKVGRVYIPPAAAPVPELYMPGDPVLSRKIGVDDYLPYEAFPVRGETVETDEVYQYYRNLDAHYGAHVGTAPIQMPEAGRLIADCGKMVVLDPLLRRLKAEGHKCLIYSQFTRVLDILEDYCAKTAFKFVRLDGQSALADRRDIVAEWQTNEELFVFLLSTRAGGVGLNLTAADTVIFFDSDWNPTQDLQAMDRAHRLGQERPVTVYRLISRGTIEERMLIRAQQKSRINDLVIKGGGLNTEKEEAKDTEIDDIAALLMGEEEFSAQVDATEVFDIARRASQLARNGMKHIRVQ